MELNGGADDASIATDGALDSGVGADAQIPFEASATDSSVDAGSAYAATILADGPLAYYRLNEKSGSSVASEVGGFTGAFTRGTTLGAASSVTREPGNLAATFFLQGSTDDSDLSLGDNFIFEGTQPFSVEMWFNASTIDTDARHVLSKADRVGDSPVDGWNVCVSMDPGPVIWIERSAASTNTRSTEVTIAANAWVAFRRRVRRRQFDPVREWCLERTDRGCRIDHRQHDERIHGIGKRQREQRSRLRRHGRRGFDLRQGAHASANHRALQRRQTLRCTTNRM